jgi:hypothetical protein
MSGLNGKGIDIAGAKGRWTAIEIHTRRDTGSSDGIMQVWQDGSLVVDGKGLSWAGAPCGVNKFFSNGYLMGWSNAGFDNDTFVYIDDVVFSTSYIGTGASQSSLPIPEGPDDMKQM